jgi:prepilin-type processing-associated H-X9-DG protein
MEAFGGLPMPDRDGLTITELFTLLISVSLLGTILIGAAMRREHDRDLIVCAGHLRSLALGATRYAIEHQGQMPGAQPQERDWWCSSISPYVEHFNKTILCPDAAQGAAAVGNAYAAWTVRLKMPVTKTDGHRALMIHGSYGFNGYLSHESYAAASPMEPLFGDCIWYDAKPQLSDMMPQNLFLGNYNLSRNDQMGNFCIRRHNGRINMALLGGGVETLRLSALWSLSWTGVRGGLKVTSPH